MILNIDQMETFAEVYRLKSFPKKHLLYLSFLNCAQICLQQNIRNQFNMNANFNLFFFLIKFFQSDYKNESDVHN